MALTVNPRCIQIREPNLRIPGKKPVGPVRVDWSHPLSKGLRQYFIGNHGRGSAIDLARGYQISLTHGSTATSIDHRGYVAGEGTTRLQAIYSGDSNAFQLVNSSPSALTYIALFIQYATYGSGEADFGSGFYVIGEREPIGARVYNRQLAVGMSSDVTREAITSTDWVQLNTPLFVGMSWSLSDSTPEYYVKHGASVLSGSLGAEVTSIPTNQNRFYLSGYQYDALSNGNNAYTVFTGLYNRKLSIAEMEFIAKDPYQFLIPA